MRQGMTVAVVVTAGTWAGAAAAQTQCGPFPVGEATLACACPAGFASGSVWGSGPYTADSDVCTAALHAGVIGPEGGKVMALAAEGLETYTGPMPMACRRGTGAAIPTVSLSRRRGWRSK